MQHLNTNTTEILSHIVALYKSRVVVYDSNSNGKLQVGKPLTKEAAKSIFNFVNQSSLNQRYGFKDIIPKNILYFDQHKPKVIWHTPMQYQKLFFLDQLPIASGTYPIVSMIWKLDANGLYIYAVKDQIVSIDTPLFQAPFLNVDHKGKVCMGSAKFKSKSTFYNQWIAKAQQAFFNSTFTHTNTSNLLEKNIVDVMQEMSEKRSTSFDTSLLISTPITIENLLND